MRSIVSRVVRAAVGLIPFFAVGMIPMFGIGMAASAADAAPNCPSLEASFANTPVEIMSQPDAEQTVWCLTNDQRSANGVAPLSLNSILGGTARAHAKDATIRQWWITDTTDTHTNPDGQTPLDRIVAAHYCDDPKTLEKVSENTYWGWGTGGSPTPSSAVTWWMGDKPHRDTILDPALKDLGVGVVPGSPRPPSSSYPHAAVFVQDFGTCTK